MRNREYWRKNLTISAIALFVWIALTVVIGFHARELQGLLVLYVTIIGFYAWYLKRLDRLYGVQQRDEP